MSADKKIITDRPYETGVIKGFQAVRENSRDVGADQLPADQQADYMQGFKRGVNSALNPED